MKNDLTTGKIAPTLLKFALPFLLANALQAIYGATDLFIIGHFTDPQITSASVSAVATGSQFMHTITMMILGLCIGTTVIIAKYTGAKDYDKLSKSIGTSTIFFIILAVVLTPLILTINNQVVSFLQTPVEAINYTKEYLFYCSLGIPFIIGYNLVSSIFRGLGDSKTPLIFIGIACVFNIAIDYVLVAHFNFGAKGAAIATSFAQLISLVFSIFYMKIKGFYFELNKSHFKINIDILKNFFKVGVPLALQDTLINLSFLIIIAVVNTMGVTSSAAVGVVSKLLAFLFLPQSAFAAAISTISSQNIGAGKPKRSFQSLYIGIFFSMIYAIVTFIISQVKPEIFISIFTVNPEVLEAGCMYLRSFSFDFLLVSCVFCFNTFFASFNKALFSMIHSLIATFLIRIPISFAVSRMANGTLKEMGFAAPLSSLFSIIACLIFFYFLRKKVIYRKQNL